MNQPQTNTTTQHANPYREKINSLFHLTPIQNVSSETRPSRKTPLLAIWFVFIFINISYMMLFLGGMGRGNIDWHLLPSSAFSIPDKVLNKGFTPLYDKTFSPFIHVGWDGQFYYYIANDPFARSDWNKRAYRYQRIGLPIVSHFLSKMFGQDWVSPLLYYGTNLFFTSLGVYFLAGFFSSRGRSPALALFWGLAYGTQISVLHGLEDAFADSFLIISIISYLNKRFFLTAITATLACLSREMYIIFPFLVAANGFLRMALQKGTLRDRFQPFQKYLWMLLPGGFWLGWQAYLTILFKQIPALNSPGNITTIFTGLSKDLIDYFYAFLHIRDFEFIYLSLFSLILFLGCGLTLFSILKFKWHEMTPILLSFLFLSLLYFSLSHQVLAYRTNYLRPIAIFGFIIPFLIVTLRIKIPLIINIILSLSLLFFNISLLNRYLNLSHYDVKYHHSYYSLDRRKVALAQWPPLQNHNVKIELRSVEPFFKKGTFRERMGRPEVHLYRIKLFNLGEQTLPMVLGDGAIRLSYRWFDPHTAQVVANGVRTYIQKNLEPGEILEMPMIVEYPLLEGPYTVQISLVQDFKDPKKIRWFHHPGTPESLEMTINLHGSHTLSPDSIIANNPNKP